MEGFDDNDLTAIIGGIHYRNNFTHELHRWLVDDKLPSLDRNFINIPLNLFFKISNCCWVATPPAATKSRSVGKTTRRKVLVPVLA
jgi:hypothetical protein